MKRLIVAATAIALFVVPATAVGMQQDDSSSDSKTKVYTFPTDTIPGSPVGPSSEDVRSLHTDDVDPFGLVRQNFDKELMDSVHEL